MIFCIYFFFVQVSIGTDVLTKHKHRVLVFSKSVFVYNLSHKVCLFKGHTLRAATKSYVNIPFLIQKNNIDPFPFSILAHGRSLGRSKHHDSNVTVTQQIPPCHPSLAISQETCPVYTQHGVPMATAVFRHVAGGLSECLGESRRLGCQLYTWRSSLDFTYCVHLFVTEVVDVVCFIVTICDMLESMHSSTSRPIYDFFSQLSFDKSAINFVWRSGKYCAEYRCCASTVGAQRVEQR